MIQPQEIADILFSVEIQLIKSLVRNIGHHRKEEKKYKNNWQAWQVTALRNLVKYKQETRRILEDNWIKLNKDTVDYIQEQWREPMLNRPVVVFNTVNKDRVETLIQETETMNQDVKSAVFRQSEDVYRRVVEEASIKLQSGGYTLNKAIDSATKDFLERGYDCIYYKNGRRVNIQSYTEMAMRTAGKRAHLMSEGAVRESLGIDTVLISQYGACSKTCLPWQGKVYIDDVYQPFKGTALAGSESRAYSRNGGEYMRLSYAIKNGLFHPNCRHNVSDYIEGVTRIPPPIDPKKIEKASHLESVQRAMERDVRKYKRLYNGTLDEDSKKEYRRKLARAQKRLNQFVKENSDVLRRDYWRESVIDPP